MKRRSVLKGIVGVTACAFLPDVNPVKNPIPISEIGRPVIITDYVSKKTTAYCCNDLYADEALCFYIMRNGKTESSDPFFSIKKRGKYNYMIYKNDV